MASPPTAAGIRDASMVSVSEDGLSIRSATAAEKLTARLDRLPMTRTLWIMAILLTFGGFFDGYAIGLIGALAPGLFKAKIFTPTTVGFFGISGFASFVASLFLGFFVVTLFVSYIADRFGRRAIFAYSLLWFGIANFIMASLSTANGINFWRFVSALGIGLELVTVDAYLSELIPKRCRGAAFAFLQAMSAIAFLVTYLLSWRLTPIQLFGHDGWRWVAWIGSIAAVVIWWIRLGLPESPRWLAQQGRQQEAERIMADIERRVEADYGRPLPQPEPAQYQETRKGSLWEIFSPAYIKRTTMLVLFNFFQTVGFYGFVAWTPTLLIAKGIHITQSLGYSAVINVAAVIFPFLIILFADKIERKWHACLSCLAIAVFGVWFGSATSSWSVIVLGACLAMAAQWLSYGLHNYQAELYPTRIRARAVGFVYSWSRLSGILTPFFIAFFLRDFGTPGVFAFVAVCMGIVILSVAVLGPRTNMLEVEAIAH
jgi:MFS transporter, putative metabolite:H+ symporter